MTDDDERGDLISDGVVAIEVCAMAMIAFAAAILEWI